MRYSTVFLAIVASALAVQAQDFNAETFGGRRGGGRGRFRGNGGRFGQGQNGGQDNNGNASADGGDAAATSTDVANPQITAPPPQQNVDFGNGNQQNGGESNDGQQNGGDGQQQNGGDGSNGSNGQDQGQGQGESNQDGQSGNDQGSQNNNNGNNNNGVVDNGQGTPTTIGKMVNDGKTEGLQQATSTDAGTAATQSAGAEPVGQSQGNVQNVQALQDSLTLDPSQVMTNIQLDGNQVPADGQSASITSKNNFINFCATKNLPLTNGEQVKTGSCNPVPMGVIIASDKMPSCKFTFPKNLDTIQAGQDFDIKLKINNFQAGNFVNAKSNYFGGPAFTNGQGIIIGHSHVVIEAIESLTTTNTKNPLDFAFFKGINTGADQNGELTATVTGGLTPGTYKLSTINSAANHQPYLVAVAQHGSLDDTVYFTVSDNANQGNNGGNNNGNNGGNNGGNGGRFRGGNGQGNGQTGQRMRRGAQRRAHHF